jgi:hypothetical protein
VSSPTHPLFGHLLKASGFKRWRGQLLLVVTLPDGSAGTIPAEATNVLPSEAPVVLTAMFSADGFRHLHQMVSSFGTGQRRPRLKTRK